MTGRYLRAGAFGLGAAALALLMTRLPIVPVQDRSMPTAVFCVVMIAIACADWVAPWLAYRVLRRDPSVTALRDQVVRFIATAAGASGIALLGALYLAGLRLADGWGLIVLTGCLVAFNVGPAIWTVNYFRRT